MNPRATAPRRAPGDDACAADHDHDEGLGGDRRADAGVHPRDGDKKPAGDGGERRPEAEPDRRDPRGVHAHQQRRRAVLRQRPHRPAGLRVVDEEQHGEDEDDRDGEDQRAVRRQEGVAEPVDAGDDRRDAALLLAEEREGGVLEQEGGTDREEHGILLPRRVAHDPPEEEDLEGHADQPDRDRRADERGGVGQAETP